MFEEGRAYAPVVTSTSGRVEVLLDADHPGVADPEYRSRRNQIAALALAWQPGTAGPGGAVHARGARGLAHRGRRARGQARPARLRRRPRRRRPAPAARRPDPAAGRGVGGARAADRIPVPPRRRARRPAGVLRLARGPDLLVDAVRQAPLRAPLHARARRHPRGHRARHHARVPSYADLYVAAGRAARRVETDTALEFLSKVFWFSLEFGVVAEPDGWKAYGAGLLSSYGEIEEFARADIRPLDITAMGTTTYDITHYQPVLFGGASWSGGPRRRRRVLRRPSTTTSSNGSRRSEPRPSDDRANPGMADEGRLRRIASRHERAAHPWHRPRGRHPRARRGRRGDRRRASSTSAAPTTTPCSDGSRSSARPRSTRAVAAARRAMHEDPLPQWRRAEILDRAAELLAERREEFARTIAAGGGQADLDRARRGGPGRRHAAVLRRGRPDPDRRGGAARGVGCRRGQARVRAARARGRRRRDLAVQLPAQPGGAQARSCRRRRLRGGAQAGQPDALLGLDPAGPAALDEAGLPAGYLSVVTGGGGIGRQRAGGQPRHRADHVHRVARGRAGASGRGRLASGSGSSSGTTPRSSSSPTATGRSAVGKIRMAGFAHAGQSCISTQRVLVHESIADEVVEALVAAVGTLVVGDPMDEAHRGLGADLAVRARPGQGLGRRGGGGRRARRGRRRPRRRRRPAADGRRRRRARPQGLRARGVRPRGRGDPVLDVRRGAARWPTTPATGCRRGSSPPTSARRSPRHGRWTSAGCWSTRCRPGGPTRCRTAGCATAATPVKARPGRCGR